MMGSAVMGALLGVVLSAGIVFVLPAVLAKIGFTTGGIAAGSIAAWMMSFFAQAGGGGVASGGLVAVLQSWGAAGLSWIACAAVIIVGGAVGWLTNLI